MIDPLLVQEGPASQTSAPVKPGAKHDVDENTANKKVKGQPVSAPRASFAHGHMTGQI